MEAHLDPNAAAALVEVTNAGGVVTRRHAEAECDVDVSVDPDLGPEVVVVLSSGSSWHRVPASAGVRYRVRVPRASLLTNGAVFLATVEWDGTTMVVALEGAVTIEGGGEPVQLGAGQAVLVSPDGNPGSIIDATPEELAADPWIAQNRALDEAIVDEPVEVEPEPEPEPPAEEPEAVEPEVVEVEAAIEPEPEAVEPEPEPEAVIEPEPEAEVAPEVAEEPEAEEPAAETPPEPEVVEEPEPELVAAVEGEAVAQTLPLEEPAEKPIRIIRRNRYSSAVGSAIAVAAAIILVIALLPKERTKVAVLSDTNGTAVETIPTTAAPRGVGAPATTAARETTTTAAPKTTTTVGSGGAAKASGVDSPGWNAYSVEIKSCGRSGGSLVATGTLKNGDVESHTYVIEVSFRDNDKHTVAGDKVRIEGLKPSTTKTWNASAGIPSGTNMSGGDCFGKVLLVES